MRKNFLSLMYILLSIFILFVFISTDVSASEMTDEFEYYVIDNSTSECLAWVYRYIGNKTHVSIPEYIENAKVNAMNAVEYFVSKEIEELYIPKTIQFYFGSGVYGDICIESKLKRIIVSEENQYLSSSDGVLYDKDKESLLCYPIKKREPVFTIPKSVNFIFNCNYKEELPFYGNKYLKKLYVYENSYGLEWAKLHEFPYEIIDDIELVDSQTGIKVNGTMNSKAILNTLTVENTIPNSIATYDISLIRDYEPIQPEGTITISIPSEYDDCKVLWIKDDGTTQDMNAEYTDGNYVFETDHLSVYALVRDKTIVYGDVDCDSAVSITDATEIQKYVAQLVELSDEQKAVADADGDGAVSIIDATQIQKYIAQLIDKLG